MSHIRSRKHSATPSTLSHSLLALAAFALPFSAVADNSSSTAGNTTLPEVKVKSAPVVPFKANTVSSPKLTQPLLDTPQTISVIKKEIMKEQGISSVVEALRNTPGITLQLGENGNTSVGDAFQMRGFATDTSIFVDGVRDLAAVTRDTFNIEQVEVVKGPAGADVGRGAVSGYINLQSKLPQMDEFGTAAASLNSANNKRVSADYNRPLSDSSAVRVNVMAQDGGVVGRDQVKNQGVAIAPSLAFGLGTPTRVYLFSQHIRQDNRPDGGVPTIGLPGFYAADNLLKTGARVNSANYYGSSKDYEKVSTDMLSAKIEHELGKTVVLRNITRYGRATMDRVLTGVNGLSAPTANSASWTAVRTRQRVDRENEILANQTNLTAELELGGFSHSLSGGIELMKESQNLPTFAVPTGVAIAPANLYAPDANVNLPIPQANGAYTNGSTTTLALYAFDTLKLNKQWQFTAGIRYERYRTESDVATLSTAAANPSLPVGTLLPTSLKKTGNLLNWKTGLVYKPAANGSVYAAMASSFTPPGSSNFALSATTGNINSPALEPQKTTNLELGTKWELLDKRLALSAALYRTDNQNEVVTVDATSNTFAQFGKRRVEGVELGVVGQITPAWQISAGVATMKTRVLQGSTGNNAAGAASRWSPDLSATLWSSYKINPQWTVGGGARYVSEQKRVVDPALPLAVQNMPNIGSYTVADALLSFQATRKISLQLNVYNLFDRDYVASLNNSGARYSPSAKRSAQLTANLQF